MLRITIKPPLSTGLMMTVWSSCRSFRAWNSSKERFRGHVGGGGASRMWLLRLPM